MLYHLIINARAGVLNVFQSQEQRLSTQRLNTIHYIRAKKKQQQKTKRLQFALAMAQVYISASFKFVLILY